MGTKKDLAQAVADIVACAQPGIFLDAFSGMCSVAAAVGQDREIWTNDAQKFSSQVATALFASKDDPPQPIRVADIHYDKYQQHRSALRSAYLKSLRAEEIMCDVFHYSNFQKTQHAFAAQLLKDGSLAPARKYSLFTNIYANTYLGLSQAIDIDSIVRSMNWSLNKAQITEDHFRWLLIALGRAMIRCSNTTGHFAQYLKPNQTSFKVFIRQRKRCIWDEWLDAVEELTPIGTQRWRRNNRVFNEDSLTLLPQFSAKRAARPSVVYADPPYTDDQYSRFYHLFETLVLYDYPKTSGAGLYRAKRFRTSFSVKAEAVKAMDLLIATIAKSGSDIVLSYPTNGLVYEAGGNPKALLKKHFRKVELCYSGSHQHSTFGASKGDVKTAATEQIFLGHS